MSLECFMVLEGKGMSKKSKKENKGVNSLWWGNLYEGYWNEFERVFSGYF